MVGSCRALDRMGKIFISRKFSMRESYRLGCGNHCEHHAELLNRIVTVRTSSDGGKYVRIEPDIRHAELVLRDLGLAGSKVKPLTPPGFKLDQREVALRELEVPLEATGASMFRCCVMRIAVFSQDQADLGELVKCFARSMAKPTFVGYQTHGLSFVSSSFPKQHFDLH